MARLQDVIQRDTRASQPAATAVPIGTLYYVTDEAVTERSNGTTWDDVTDNGAGSTGTVVGPGVVVDNALTRFDGTTGNLIQSSPIIAEDDGRLSNVTDPSGAQDAATKNYVDGLLPIAEADVTGLVADLALLAPLASPTLTGVITLAGQYFSPFANKGNTGASPAIDWDDGNEQRWVLNAATVTFAAPTNPQDGGRYVLKLLQDATGGRALVLPASFKFPGGTTPTWTTTANHWDLLTLLYDATDSTYTVNAALDFS